MGAITEDINTIIAGRLHDLVVHGPELSDSESSKSVWVMDRIQILQLSCCESDAGAVTESFGIITKKID